MFLFFIAAALLLLSQTKAKPQIDATKFVDYGPNTAGQRIDAPAPRPAPIPAQAYNVGGILNPDVCSNQEDNSHSLDCSRRGGKFTGHYTKPSPLFVRLWNEQVLDRNTWDVVHTFPDFSDLTRYGVNTKIPRP